VRCPRTLAVIDPVLVHITNLKDDELFEVDVPDFPTEYLTNPEK
jgi:hypothetical protein